MHEFNGPRGARLINTTPHAIGVYPRRGKSPVCTLPAATESTLVRVASGEQTREMLRLPTGVMVPVVSMTWGDIVGLPEPQRGVTFVVSTVVAAAAACSARGADDLVVPQSLVRDGDGQIIGCRTLALASTALPGLADAT